MSWLHGVFPRQKNGDGIQKIFDKLFRELRLAALELLEQMLKPQLLGNAGAALGLLRWHCWLKPLLRSIVLRLCMGSAAPAVL